MPLSSFFKIISRFGQQIWQSAQLWWKQVIKANSVSSEYAQWRHRFILSRLHLMTWIAIITCLMDLFFDLTIVVPSFEPNSREYNFVQQNLELILGNTIILFSGLLLIFVLLKVSFFRRYPIWILLWLTFLLLVFSQLLATVFLGEIRLYNEDWIVVFAAGPILMPVRWRWHFLCQVMVMGHFAVNYWVFGLRDPYVTNEIEYFHAVHATVIACLIVNLGVYLYEKFLQQQFELRQKLQLFIYTVSHDLRNPVLSTMFLLKSLCASAVDDVVIARETLNRIIDSSDRQLQLIDSLLEAHTTQTQGIILRPRPVCLDNLLESVIVEMQPFLDQQQATITKKIAAKLPLVNIDPLQIRRVYENLIANALEYNRPGLHLTFQVESDREASAKAYRSVTDRESFRAYPLGYPKGLHSNGCHRTTIKSQPKIDFEHWIYCLVSDNGEGIALQQSSQIFELYTRAASKKQSLNVGLGLYICRQIIKAHGGEIGVNSSSKGASFWFTLPVAG
jgi:signal transduction histidine kinase